MIVRGVCVGCGMIWQQLGYCFKFFVVYQSFECVLEYLGEFCGLC